MVDIVITFGQQVEMEQFITLYQALYRNGSVGDLSVHPIWDNSTSLYGSVSLLVFFFSIIHLSYSSCDNLVIDIPFPNYENEFS